MLAKELKKIFELAKRNGDRFVVYDSNSPENSFVLMSLDSYESLLNDNKPKEIKEEKEEKKAEKEEKKTISEDLTDEDLTDRINREISLWKNEEEPNFLSEDEKNRKPWKIPESMKKKAKEIE